MPDLSEWHATARRIQNLDGRIFQRNARNVKLRADIDVHVITGRLKRSHRIETIKGSGRRIEGYRVIAGTDDEDDLERAPYASYEEFGTRFRIGHPSLTPALVRERPRIGNVDLRPYLADGGFYISRGIVR